MQDRNIHILCTKKIDDQLIATAATTGISIDVASFIHANAIDPHLLTSKLTRFSGERTTVIFTSANAVQAVSATGIDTSNWELFCIGGATKRSVQQAFPYATIRAIADDGASLGTAILQAGIRENLVYCCGNKRRDELPSVLGNKGIRLEEVVCYETHLAPRHVDRLYDGILFFSPSAVESYLSANGIMPAQTLFCIGKTTAAALQPWENKVVIADSPEPKNLIEKMIGHYKPGLIRYE